MLKTILKVFYMTVAFVLAFIIYIGMNNSFQYDYLVSVTTEAAENHDYVKFGKMTRQVFNSENVIDEKYANLENNSIACLESLGDIEYVLYEKNSENEYESTKTVVNELSYVFYLMNPNFDTKNINLVENECAFAFYKEGSDEPYKYLMYAENVTNDKINSEEVITYPENESEYLLNSQRDYFNLMNHYKFTTFDISEGMVKAIEDKLGGKIVGFNILQNDGSKVYEENISVNFSFESEFFTLVSQLKDKRNEYNYYQSDASNVLEDKEAKLEEAKNSYIEYQNEFFKNNIETNDKYQLVDTSLFSSSSTTWQTIGVVALYVLGAAILYILLFNFKLIKRIIFREKQPSGKYGVNPGVAQNRKKEVIDEKKK